MTLDVLKRIKVSQISLKSTLESEENLSGLALARSPVEDNQTTTLYNLI